MMFEPVADKRDKRARNLVARITNAGWAKSHHMQVNAEPMVIGSEAYSAGTLMVRIDMRYADNDGDWYLVLGPWQRSRKVFVLPEMTFMSDLVESCL